jgi:hypothetical protein
VWTTRPGFDIVANVMTDEERAAHKAYIDGLQKMWEAENVLSPVMSLIWFLLMRIAVILLEK